MAAYQLRLTPSAMRSIDRLSDRHVWAIMTLIQDRLLNAPHRLGKPLRDELDGWRAAPCGTYRIVYWIDEDAHAMVVERIDHRADVYRPR